MKPLNIKKPYDDQFLKFNEATKRYELTIEFVKNEFDSNFRDDKVLQRRIEKNSRKIYNYIKYHSYSGNSELINKLLNETEEGRSFLKAVLYEQMEADIETGFNDLSSQPAINVANGQIIDRAELQKNQISVDAEQIIDRNADYFGFNICVMTRFPLMLQLYLKGI